MKRVSRYIKYLRKRIQDNKRMFIIYSILRGLVILTMIRMMLEKNFEGFALCILSLLLFLVPSFAEVRFRIEIPPVFEAMIYCFIFAAEILGEINHFYASIPGWDTMLHTINGFLCAAVGFSMVDLLNRHSKHVRLSPFYVAMVAFCFSMTIGVLWEFFEFAGDCFLGMDMQKDFLIPMVNSTLLDPTHTQRVVSVKHIVNTTLTCADGSQYVIQGGYLDIGIIDTMKDLFVNFIGAIVYSTFGYIYLKEYGKRQTRSAKIVDSLTVRNANREEIKMMDEERKQVLEHESTIQRKRNKKREKTNDGASGEV